MAGYEMGIDEAGRGPVLGPMVYGCALWPISRKDYFSSLGFMDSKILNEAKREELFAKIQSEEDIIWNTESIPAEKICNSMLGKPATNLNQLAIEATFKLIQFVIDSNYQIDVCYVDTLGKPQFHQKRLSERFPGIKFVVETKADATYPIVSAASICAKVTRDHQLYALADKYGVLGCGYPTDPATREWLDQNIHSMWGFNAELVRISWKTASLIHDNKLPKIEWEPEIQEVFCTDNIPALYTKVFNRSDSLDLLQQFKLNLQLYIFYLYHIWLEEYEIQIKEGAANKYIQTSSTKD